MQALSPGSSKTGQILNYLHDKFPNGDLYQGDSHKMASQEWKPDTIITSPPWVNYKNGSGNPNRREYADHCRAILSFGAETIAVEISNDFDNEDILLTVQEEEFPEYGFIHDYTSTAIRHGRRTIFNYMIFSQNEESNFISNIKKVRKLAMGKTLAITEGKRAEQAPRVFKENNFSKYQPSPSPIPCIQELIERLTPKNSVVMDPFAGTGTVPVMAELMGRKWVAIEKNPHYHYALKQRMKTVTQNT